MSGYDLALCLHVLAVVALFSGLAIVLVSLGGARRAGSVQAAREWVRTGAVVARLLPLFAVAAFVPGAYMVGQRWSWEQGWLRLAASSLLLMLLGFIYIAVRLGAVQRAAREAPDGAMPMALRRQALDPLLWLAGQSVSTAGTGVIVLMTFKPGAGASIWVFTVSLALGLLSSAPAFLRSRRLSVSFRE